jgi:N-methylhydantoinase A
VVAGIESAGSGAAGALLHGTTVATNALLERKGARTILVTDEGFEDLLEIGRQDRPSLYDTARVRPIPIVDRAHRLGAPGRADHVGGAPDSKDLAAVGAEAARLGPEAIAISTLYSYLDPGRERALGAVLEQAVPGVPISLSSDVVAEFREYERASTTVLNAYLTPVTSRYLRALRERAHSAGIEGEIAVMRSSGGLVSLDEAARLPVSILLSGPAGGVVAATALGAALGHDRIVSFDMGGTSTDVCRIDHGRPEVAYERAIEGLPCRMPAVAIHTVGAGGGSVGWVDAGGALRVGPRSAGAIPGPASYGNGGTEPAVTDANVLLGRIDPVARLGGSVDLDRTAAEAAAAAVGLRLDMSVPQVALGMVEVVEAHMHRAIRKVSVEEGADPSGTACRGAPPTTTHSRSKRGSSRWTAAPWRR